MDKLQILKAIEILNETLLIFSEIEYVEGLKSVSQKIVELTRQL